MLRHKLKGVAFSFQHQQRAQPLFTTTKRHNTVQPLILRTVCEVQTWINNLAQRSTLQIDMRLNIFPYIGAAPLFRHRRFRSCEVLKLRTRKSNFVIGVVPG